MDTPHPPPRSAYRRSRRLAPIVSAHRVQLSGPRGARCLPFDLHLRLRQRAEAAALFASLSAPSPALRFHAQVRRRERAERLAMTIGAIGIVGFVSASVGMAAGYLDAPAYLALSLGSLAEYAGGLLLAHRK